MSWAMVSKEGWETRGDSKVTWSLAGMLGFCFPLFWVEGGEMCGYSKCDRNQLKILS